MKSIGTDVKDVLNRIKEINQLADKLKAGNKKPDSLDDIYEYEYNKPDLETKSHILLHGKCYQAGMKQLFDWGYVAQPVKHYAVNDEFYSRVRCQHCNKQLNPKTAEKITKEISDKKEQRAKSYAAWIKKQMLLGKM